MSDRLSFMYCLVEKKFLELLNLTRNCNEFDRMIDVEIYSKKISN